jgi:hypothetical protein
LGAPPSRDSSKKGKITNWAVKRSWSTGRADGTLDAAALKREKFFFKFLFSVKEFFVLYSLASSRERYTLTFRYRRLASGQQQHTAHSTNTVGKRDLFCFFGLTFLYCFDPLVLLWPVGCWMIFLAVTSQLDLGRFPANKKCFTCFFCFFFFVVLFQSPTQRFFQCQSFWNKRKRDEPLRIIAQRENIFL